MAKFANTKGLSKQEKYMVQGMIVEENSVEEIAKYLDREVELVEGFIEDLKPTVTEDESTQEAVNKLQHIINKTAAGNKGIVAMTPAGSQQGDASRERNNRGSHNAKNESYTHQIHE